MEEVDDKTDDETEGTIYDEEVEFEGINKELDK